MRASAVTNIAANGVSTPAFTLYSEDTLAILINGTGNLTVRLEYMGEAFTGTPYLPASIPNSTTAFSITSTTTGVWVFTGLPRGYYRLTSTAWTSGSKDVQLVAY